MAMMTISVFVCVVGIVCGAGTRNMAHFIREPVVCEDVLAYPRSPDLLEASYLEQCLEICLSNITCKVATFFNDSTCRTYSDTTSCTPSPDAEIKSFLKIS